MAEGAYDSRAAQAMSPSQGSIAGCRRAPNPPEVRNRTQAPDVVITEREAGRVLMRERDPMSFRSHRHLSSGKTSSGKTSSEKTSSGKISFEKTSSDKTWLLAIGRRLRTEYDVPAHPIPERLAALLKQLQECDVKVESPPPAPPRR